MSTSSPGVTTSEVALDDLAALQARYLADAASVISRLVRTETQFERLAVEHNSLTRELLDAQRGLLRRRLLTAESLTSLGVVIDTDEDDERRRQLARRQLRELLDGWWADESARAEEVIRRAEVRIAMASHFADEVDPAAQPSSSTAFLSSTITQILDDAGDTDLVLALSMLVDDLADSPSDGSGEMQDHAADRQQQAAAVFVLDGTSIGVVDSDTDEVRYSQEAFDSFWAHLPPKAERPRPRRRFAAVGASVAFVGAGLAVVASGLGWS